MFGLYLNFKTRDKIFVGGGGDFFSAILFFTNIRLCTGFQLHVYPGTGRKVVGGGWVGGG